MRWLYFALCFFWLLTAFFFPTDWYETLPLTDSARAFPVSGITLFRLSFVFEACLFIWLALGKWRYIPTPADLRLETPNVGEKETQGSGWETKFLFAVVFLGLFLRLYQIDSGLWLDELNTANHSHDSFLRLFTLMTSTNNHLLNSLLIKLSVGLFGESEWSVRLPAMLFGVLSIPAIYWVSRMMMPRWMSVYVALLLSLSYHHIFFSQNARGYIFHLFFSLLSAGLFFRGLQTDKAKVWVAYILAMFLNIASLISSVFVLAAHVLTSAIVLIVMWRQGKKVAPLFRRMFGVYLIIGLLTYQLYSIIFPQYLAFINENYYLKDAGFSPLSIEFFQELVRGISAGFGTGALFGMVPFLLVAILGVKRIFKNNYILALLLLLPGVVTAVFLMAKGLTFSPRFFLFELYFALLATVAGLYELSRYLAPRLESQQLTAFKLTSAGVAVVSIVFAGSLVKYYSVPKQNYRAALNYVETVRKPGQKVIVIHLAEHGTRYYVKRLRLDEDNYYYVRSVEKLDKVLANNKVDDFYLISTFHRSLRIDFPGLLSRMTDAWEREKRFDATVGDGALYVWKPK